MKAALYIRVSTEEQALHGLSIEAQTQALEAWAKEEQATVVGKYVDAGISARKPAAQRPSLQRLLTDIQQGRVELVVFTKLDRWFRNIAEYYKVQEVLEKHGVSWKAIQEDYDTATASGRFKVNIMLAVAQDEADRTSERIKAVFAAKKSRGEAVSGSVPPGIKIENKRRVADPELAPVMQDIFRFFIAHHSLYATQRYAAATHGLRRDITTLRRLLQNQSYRGLVIDADLFDTAQELIATRAQRNSGIQQGRIFLFSGLIRCSTCGKKMTGIVSKGIYYYRCTTHVYVGDCPYKKYVREDMVEQWLLSHIVSACDIWNTEAARAHAQRPRIDEVGIRRKMSKLKDLYLSDLIDREEYARDYAALRETLEKAAAIAPPPRLLDTEALRSALALYGSMAREEKKEFWLRTVSDICIQPDHTVSFIPRYT